MWCRRMPTGSNNATDRRSARRSHLQLNRQARPLHGTRPNSRSVSASGKKRGNSRVIKVRSRSPSVSRRRSPSAEAKRKEEPVDRRWSPLAEGKRRGLARRCCGSRRRRRCWDNRRTKLSSLMLLSSLFAFGIGLLVAVQQENKLFQTLCLANLVSSGCWHSNNLFMDGAAVGRAGKCCCWIDRVCVAVTVAFGVWLAAAKGLQVRHMYSFTSHLHTQNPYLLLPSSRLQLSAVCGSLVPVLYAIKGMVPKSERYLRTIIHCIMHQVGVLGGLVFAVLTLPATEFETERRGWWDGVTAFMSVVCLVQPVVGWLAYQSTKSLPRRENWIWI